RRYLDAVRPPALRPLTVLEMPVADLYGEHWSLTARGVPDADSPDAAVVLPGRNVLLFSHALLWCHLDRAPTLALEPLRRHPVPGAGTTDRAAYARERA